MNAANFSTERPDPLEIRILLDDSTPLHPFDAGGTVVLHQGFEEARSDFVLVDEWLAELAAGVDQYEESGVGCADFSQSRSEMRLQELPNAADAPAGASTNIEVRWGNFCAVADEEQFLEEVRRVAADLLVPFRDHADYPAAEQFAKLERWLKGEPLEPTEEPEASADSEASDAD
jgi:hypothetical protein